MGMLFDVERVCRDTATCLDDPSMSEFDKDYLIPFINLNWQDLSNQLAKLGLEYQEGRVVLPALQPDTADLNDFMQSGQALESLMLPKLVEWKIQDAPDTSYSVATKVGTLRDVMPGSIGLLAWKWAGGSIQVTPSAAPIDVRVTFDAMSVNLVDPADETIRGCSNILAYKTASLIYSIRGNDPLAAKMELRAEAAKEDFEGAAVMRDQALARKMPPAHPRISRRASSLASTTTQ